MLVDGIRAVQREQETKQAAAREARRTPVRNVLSFVAATLFFMKSKVCPNVILPDKSEVRA